MELMCCEVRLPSARSTLKAIGGYLVCSRNQSDRLCCLWTGTPTMSSSLREVRT